MSLAAALDLARHATVAGLEDVHPGTITIAGTDYVCAIVEGGVRPAMTEFGERNRETLRVDVRKVLLPDAPSGKTVIYRAGVPFMIESIQGHGLDSMRWVLRLFREVAA